MQPFRIQFHTILSAIIFTAVFVATTYLIVSWVDIFMYKIIISLLSFILYINTLRLFLFEILTLEKTRASEILNYFLMYVVTVSVLIIPFFIEPVYVFEVSLLRNIIIFFASVLLIKYFLYMVMGPIHDILHKWKREKICKNKEYKPLVSVMIPAWNERVGVLNTIKSILKNNYRNIEIVVINDGSTDDSDQIIRNFINEYEKNINNDIKIIYEYKKNGGKGSALNTAIEISNGEILISIDADCIVDKEAISAFVEEFKDPKVMAAVGNVKIGNKNSTVGIVQYLEFLFSFYFKRAESLMGSIYIIGGAAGAFRREVFKRLGEGYSTNNITEDIELTVRIQDAGMKISYVPDALVYTEGASDLESLKKQRLRWKRGRFQTFYQHYHMFFSTKKKHNKALTFFVMPMAVFQEVQLLLEIPFIIFLYTFSVLNSDFTSLFSGVIVVGAMFIIQFLFYDKSTRNFSFIALAPIGWLIFYIATYVEAFALLKSIKLFITGKELKWQKWERKGVVSSD